MNDLISRQAAIDALSKEPAVWRDTNETLDPYSSGMREQWYRDKLAIMRLSSPQQTVDAVEVVRCKNCKYRPIKEDPNGDDYGFNLIHPDEDNEKCPCIVSDGWYSWMPKDDWFCANGEIG